MEVIQHFECTSRATHQKVITLCEKRGDALIPVIENVFDIAADEQGVGYSSEGAEREAIAHDVGHERSAVYNCKAMRVMPQPVWPLPLDIYKTEGRLPAQDREFSASVYEVFGR